MGSPDEWDRYEYAIFLAHPGGALVWVTSEVAAVQYEEVGFKRTTRTYYENRLYQEKLKRALQLYDDQNDDSLFPPCPLNAFASGLMRIGYEVGGWLYDIRLMVVREN